jgi:hypothetical protein
MARPTSRFVRSWPEHVGQWFAPARTHVAYLSYESLRRDPVPTLKGALERFLDEPVDEARLQKSVDRYEFKRVSGREAGSEDRKAFTRKGVAGDWINHFSREAAEIFDHFAGQTLIDLGYEADHSWIERVDPAGPGP